jgi:hypothetical protein
MSSLPSIPKLSASQQQRPLTTLKPDIFLIFLAFTALTPAALPTATGPRKDNKNNLALVQTILDELLAGNFELLEAQYQEFKNQTQPDGTPKLWLYFAAFAKATHDLSSDLTQVGIHTQKPREWLQQKTDSVPALLALCGTLLGEIGKIRDPASKPPSPDNLQQLRQRADELNRIIRGSLNQPYSGSSTNPNITRPPCSFSNSFPTLSTTSKSCRTTFCTLTHTTSTSLFTA